MSVEMGLIATVAGFFSLAAVIIVPVTVDNLIWERVATACIEKGGTWERTPILGTTSSDWRCRL